MSKLAKLTDSIDESSYGRLIEKLKHNINSCAYTKAGTVIDVINKLDLNVSNLTILLEIVKSGMQKFNTRKLEREYSELKIISKNIEDKIKFYGLPGGIKNAVSELVSPKLGRSASRKARAEERQKDGVNQTKEHRIKENLSRFPEIVKIIETKEDFRLKKYISLELSEEEGKRIYGIRDYFTKLISKNTVTKSELMGLTDMFNNASKFLLRFGGVVDYAKVNNLENRLTRVSNKCGTRIPYSDLEVDYTEFMVLISKR